MVRSRQRGVSEWVFDILRYIVLAVMLVITVYPFYSVVVVSFSTQRSYIANPAMLYPLEFTLDSYKVIFSDAKIVSSFFNSVFIAVVGSLYSLILITTSAYVLTKTHVKGIRILFFMIVFTMFFNGGLIPNYLNIKRLGIMNTLWAVILPGGINTFYLIVLINAMYAVPKEMEESAVMDGANEVVILFRIMLPLVLPTIMAVMLFGFVDRWNDWYSAMIYIADSTKWPVSYLLRQMLSSILAATDAATQRLVSQKTVYSEGLKRATIVFAMVPIICIYPFMQRYFAKGIMVGAIKG